MPRHRPSNKDTQSNRRYHDRVANRYDKIYDDPYWEFHDRVTWNHLKPLLPGNPQAAVLDLGCGTGKWGLKLLKAGYATTFVDLSQNMLAEVQKKLDDWKNTPDLAAKAARATVLQADATDLRALPENHFDLITAMGDVVSICSNPAQCLSEVHRILKSPDPDKPTTAASRAPNSPGGGGVFVFTVDNHLAAIDHFIDSGNLDALADFVKTGHTHWLTKNVNERFPVHMFTPAQIDSLTRSRGFEIISRIGKTIIPARQNRKLFEFDHAIETLTALEGVLQKDPAAAARASHLQLAARKI